MAFNLPNLLTWQRILAIPLLVCVYLVPFDAWGEHSRNLVATILFILASLTDWLDGWLARRLGQQTELGAFLDPVADKLLVCVALVMLLDLGRINAGIAIIIIGREITMQTKRDLNPYPDAVQKTMTPERKDINLTADTAFSFSLTSSTPLGGAVHEWKSGTDSVQLLLLPGQSNQAKVCWNVNTQLVKRLQCMVWQVPANWKRGQELESVDQYIVDDRSVYPNEQGMRYFRTAVQPD